MLDGKRVAQVCDPVFTREGGLRWSGSVTDQVGVGDGNVQMLTDPVCEQQCLVELSPTEPFVVQRDRYDQVDGIQSGKCGEHQVGQGCYKRNLALVLQQADRVLERRGIGI